MVTYFISSSYVSVFWYFIATIITVLVTIKILADKIHSRKLDPIRKRYPPIGATILHILFYYHRLHDFVAAVASRHTTFRVIAGWRQIYFTAEPANVEHILVSSFNSYGKGQYNYLILKDIFGDGIFTVDGEKWHKQRRAASLELATKDLRNYTTMIFQEKAITLAKIVADAANSKQTIDIQDLVLKSALDAIFKMTFGVEFDDVCSTPEEGAKFGAAIDEANHLSSFRYADILWQIKKRLNIGSEAKLKKCVEITDRVVYKLIEKRAEQIKQSQSDNSVKRYDLLSKFLHSEENPKKLRDLTLSFVLPSRDPTSATLVWFFYMLCKHPEIQEKIAQEIKKVTMVKNVADVTEFAAKLSDEALAKMNYLHAVLTETIRLYPAVPLNVKECLSDDTLPDGYSVNKGDLVFFGPYAMGRKKSIWGDDAEVFLPDRWLGKDGVFQPTSPFKFIAFLAGPRTCLGKEFAYKQMKIFAAVLINRFIFKLRDERKPIKYTISINLFVQKGLHVYAVRR